MRFLTLLAFTCALQTFAPRSEGQIPREGLPEIKPGEARTIRLQDMPEPSRRFFNDPAAIRGSEAEHAGHRYRKRDASPDEVARIDEVLAFAGRGTAKGEVKIRQASFLPDSPLVGAELLGTLLEAPLGTNITRVSRIFRLGERKVMIGEWDFSVDGGGVTQLEEFVNASVKGRPAVLAADVSPGKDALWRLTWTTPSKQMSVYIHEPVYSPSTVALVSLIAHNLSDD